MDSVVHASSTYVQRLFAVYKKPELTYHNLTHTFTVVTQTTIKLRKKSEYRDTENQNILVRLKKIKTPVNKTVISVILLINLLPVKGISQNSIEAQHSLNTMPIDTNGNALYSMQKKQEFRKLLTGGVSIAGLGSTFILLNNAWYNQYQKVPFHTFNDAGEWLQVDKAGHIWTAYNSSYLVYKMWRWAGAKNKSAVLLGGLTGLSYLTVIEYLDGRSSAWGWSWADMSANVIGVSLFGLQQAIGNNQAVRIKFSAHLENYSTSLKARANELFGSSFSERVLKDYNAQTYWISINLQSIFPNSGLPSWANLAFGYGADGMLGGFENKAYDENGILIFDASDIRRYRQWYLSADIDFSKIKTRSKLLRSVFDCLNVLKIPFPAIEFSNGKIRFRTFQY